MESSPQMESFYQGPPSLSSSPSPSPSSFSSLETSSASSESFFSRFDWKIWLLIVFILAFLGFNIFIYLAEGTQLVTNILKPITALFGSAAVSTTRQIVNVSAEGANAGIDIAAGTVNSGLDVVQKVATGSTTSPPTNSSTGLNNALNNATTTPPQENPGDSPTYEADDSYSSIQASKTAGKSGWCYIGEDRGFRSCIQVGENDQCMSGDIFPSQDICVNPNLRS